MIYRTAIYDLAGLRSEDLDSVLAIDQLTVILGLLSSDDYFVTAMEHNLVDADPRPLSAAQCAAEMMRVVTGWESANLVLQSRGVMVFVSLDSGMPVPFGVHADLRVEAIGGEEAFELLQLMAGVEWEPVDTAGCWGGLWDRVRALIPRLRLRELSPRLELSLTMLGVPDARRKATAEARRVLGWSRGIILAEDVTFLLRRTGVTVTQLVQWGENVAGHAARRAPELRRWRGRLCSTPASSWIVDVTIVGRTESAWGDGSGSLPEGDFKVMVRVGIGEGTEWVNDTEIGLTEATPNAKAARNQNTADRVRLLVGQGQNGPVWATSISRESGTDTKKSNQSIMSGLPATDR